MAAHFILDPRIEADSVPVIELPVSSVRLHRDARYPWLIVIPRLPDLADLTDLTPYDQTWVMGEVRRTALALKAATHCDKLNIANLGNMVRQLHIHVIARFTSDAAWPGPVWGVGTAVAYDDAARDRLVADLADRLKG